MPHLGVVLGAAPLGFGVFALKEDGAGGGLLQKVDAAKERTLAAAAGADDADHVSLLHIKGDVAQHLVLAEALFEVAYAEDGESVIGHASFFGHHDGRLGIALGAVDDVIGLAVHPALQQAKQARHREGQHQVDAGGDEEHLKVAQVRARADLLMKNNSLTEITLSTLESLILTHELVADGGA